MKLLIICERDIKIVGFRFYKHRNCYQVIIMKIKAVVTHFIKISKVFTREASKPIIIRETFIP